MNVLISAFRHVFNSVGKERTKNKATDSGQLSKWWVMEVVRS